MRFWNGKRWSPPLSKEEIQWKMNEARTEVTYWTILNNDYMIVQVIEKGLRMDQNMFTSMTMEANNTCKWCLN